MGGFAYGTYWNYWSSDQYNIDNGWAKNFNKASNQGGAFISNKLLGSWRVRAVRAFNLTPAAATTTTTTASTYDGIYSVPGVGFIDFRTQDGTMIAIGNQTLGGNFLWGVAAGTLNGNTVTLASIKIPGYGYTYQAGTVKFSILPSGVATVSGAFTCIPQVKNITCTPPNGPNGFEFSGTRIWN